MSNRPKMLGLGLGLALAGASCLLDRSPGDLEASSAGAGGVGGEGAGPIVACDSSDDCEPAATLCQVPECVNNVCTLANKGPNSPCEDGGVCDDEGFCKAALGQICDGDSACFEASCVDGVCCDAACDGLCESCVVAGLEGTCSPEPSGTVSGDCPGSVCDGLGACIAGELEWGATFGGYLADAKGFAIAPDDMGDSYLLTEVDGDVDFGATPVSTGVSTDVVLAKLDPSGAPLWAFQLIPTIDAHATDVKTMSDGGAVAGGYFYGDLATKVATLSNDGDADGWVVRFAADSGVTPPYAKKIGGTGHARVFAVAASADGADVLAGGLFTLQVDFGAGAIEDSLGGFDGYLIRLGPTGNVLWHQIIGGTGASGVAELLFDGDDAIAVGSFTETIMLDESKTASAGSDVFVARFDGNGTPQTSWTFGGDGDQDVTAAARMPDGGMVLVGYYDGAFDPGTGVLPFTGSLSSDDDVFVIRLGADGEAQWATSFNSTDSLRAWDVAVDPAGNIVVAGSFEGTTDFGTETKTAYNLGYSDAYLVKLGPDGTRLWVRTYGQTWDDALYGVAVDPSGHAYAAGMFDDAVVLDTAVLAEGYVDALAVKLGP